MNREQIFNNNIHLISKCIEKYFNQSKDKEDLFQVGAIYLLKSIDNFDEKIGDNFEAYASSNIRYGIYNYNNKNILRINNNQNATNAIYSSIKNGEKNGLSFEEVYSEYNSKPKMPKLDKYTFKNLYNNYYGNCYIDENVYVDFENNMIDNLMEEHIIDIAKSTVNGLRMNDKNKKVYMDYINIILSTGNEWGVLSNLSKKYGLSRERVRQIVKTANIVFIGKLEKEKIL